MIRKILSIFLLWMVVVLYESCCENLPYFVYDKIDLVVRETVINPGDSLVIGVYPNETDYVASTGGFVNSAFAWQCHNGLSGPKYQVKEVSITSQQDFNSNYPAGSVLNDLFMVEFYARGTTYNQIEGQVPLNDLDNLSKILYAQIWMKDTPDHANPMLFTVTIQDSKGNAYEATTPAITWN
jgi:hypothetical protein